MSMQNKQRILFVGLSARNVGRVVRLLRRLGIRFSMHHAITQARARQQLTEYRATHVLADDTSPHFRGDSAARLIWKSGSDATFILFTDSLSEENAAELLARSDGNEVFRACLKHPTAMMKAALRGPRAAETSLVSSSSS